MKLTLAIVSRQLWGGERVLSDPAKRRQYDSMGDVSVDLEALDMEQVASTPHPESYAPNPNPWILTPKP